METGQLNFEDSVTYALFIIYCVQIDRNCKFIRENQFKIWTFSKFCIENIIPKLIELYSS